MSLSDSIIFNGLNKDLVKDWRKEDFAVIQRRHVKEKIQNAQRRLKEDIEFRKQFGQISVAEIEIINDRIDEIFKEEFGDKFTQIKRNKNGKNI